MHREVYRAGFGIQDSDIVTRAGDHKCSALHNGGDWANNLCHIETAGIANVVTGSRWSGVAVLVAKELTDKNIDYSDIWTPPLQVNKYTEAAMSLDGGIIVSVSFRF